MLSVIIPSRNEPYLKKTILDILEKAHGEIEVIAILDGYWPPVEEIVDNKSVRYIHYHSPRGMRNAINQGVALAKGDYILKCDAHVMFAPGFDKVLVDHCKDNRVYVPRRYALDPVKWEIMDNPKYPIDYMYLDSNLHGVEWREKNKDPELAKIPIDDIMSSQGSCWMMRKSYFKMLRIMDEEKYGMFWNEFQEIGLKTWLYQGRVQVNKLTWYAHWHKTETRGYGLSGRDHQKALDHMKLWKVNLAWVEQQRHPLSWLVERFWPVPTWSEEYKNKALKDSEVMFWRKWMQKGRGEKNLHIRPLAPEVVEMVGDRKEVRIADVGAGPISTIGYTMDGVKVDYVPSDLLAEEYKEVYKYHNVVPPIYPEYQDMTKMTYPDESFDIVYCRNALDHSTDTFKAIREMARICKKGGWVYLWHFENVGRMMGYTGMHGWNIQRTEDGDCLFWSKDTKFLLSECVPGFVTEVNTRTKHPIVISKLHK